MQRLGLKTARRSPVPNLARCLGMLAMLGLAMAVIAGCGKGAPPPPERPPATVTAAAVIVRDVPYYIDEIGKCAPRESVSVVAQVAGRVDAAHFVEGTSVRKGDLLFTIDPRPFQAVVAQVEAALLQSRENLKLAEIEYARVEALKDTSAVSQTEFDQKKSAVAVAKAMVQASQANLDTAKLNLEYCQIRAPINGRLGMRLIDPGNVVKENEGSLVTIQNLDPVYADFTIPEDRLPEVRANMANGKLKTLVYSSDVQTSSVQTSSSPSTQPATAPTQASAPAQPGSRQGELSMIDNTIQDTTGTIRLRATVPNSDAFFWPGQFVQVRLVLYEQKDAMLVPQQAIQIGQQGTYVYLLKHDEASKKDLAELRPVKSGQKQGDLVVIDSGLSPGDKVIVTGQMMVMPGAPVHVVESPAAPGSKAGAEQVAEGKP